MQAIRRRFQATSVPKRALQAEAFIDIGDQWHPILCASAAQPPRLSVRSEALTAAVTDPTNGGSRKLQQEAGGSGDVDFLIS